MLEVFTNDFVFCDKGKVDKPYKPVPPEAFEMSTCFPNPETLARNKFWREVI